MPSGLPRYDYFDHDADTGVIGRGATLQEALVHAAEATFALMRSCRCIFRRDTRAALTSWLPNCTRPGAAKLRRL